MSAEQYIDAERRDLPSASSMHRVWACAGSENLIRSIPPNERVKSDDEVTASGTRVHASLAGEGNELDMTEGEIAERLKQLEQDAVDKWRYDVLLPKMNGDLPEMKVIREERCWIRDEALNELASAKPDVIYICGTCALVINYKAAFKPVTAAAKNHQCRTEAIAVWSEYYCTNIRVAVVQSRLTSTVTQADYDEELLYDAAAQLKFTLWRAAQPDAPRSAGSHCDWCVAKAHCPEVATYSLLPVASSQLSATSPSKKDVEFAVSRLTPTALAFIERRRLIAEKLFDAVKARLKSLPAEELAAVGFELGQGRNQLEVKDASGAIDLLIEKKLLTEEEVMNCFKWNNGALEEIVIPRIQKQTPGLNQLGAKNTLRGMLAPFISYDDPKNRAEPSLEEK